MISSSPSLVSSPFLSFGELPELGGLLSPKFSSLFPSDGLLDADFPRLLLLLQGGNSFVVELLLGGAEFFSVCALYCWFENWIRSCSSTCSPLETDADLQRVIQRCRETVVWHDSWIYYCSELIIINMF